MTQALEKSKTSQKIQIIVQGHQVTLFFAEKPNLQISELIKKALLSNCLVASLPPAE